MRDHKGNLMVRRRVCASASFDAPAPDTEVICARPPTPEPIHTTSADCIGMDIASKFWLTTCSPLLSEYPDFADEAATFASEPVFSDYELNRYSTTGSAHLNFHPDFTDPVEMELRQEFKYLRSKHFKYFNLSLDIERVSEHAVVIGKNGYSNILVFKVFNAWEKPRLLVARINKSPEGTSIQVRWTSAWLPLSAFLDTMKIDTTDPDKVSDYWEHESVEKGKTFTLEKLPTELRLMIFKEVLFSKSTGYKRTIAYSSKTWDRFGDPRHNPRPSLHDCSVLFLNHKLSAEACEVLYANADLVFPSCATLRKCFEHISKEHMAKIRSLTLAFDCDALQRLFGYEVGGLTLSYQRDTFGYINAIAGQLTTFTIRFGALPNSDYDESTTCHTIVTQYILERLFVVLDLNPTKLKIEGRIKHAQKSRFLQYIKDAYEELTDWRGPGLLQDWPRRCVCKICCACLSDEEFDQYLDVDDLATGVPDFHQGGFKEEAKLRAVPSG